MGSRGPLPKPEAQRRRRNKPKPPAPAAKAKKARGRVAAGKELAIVPLSHPAAIPMPPVDLNDAGRAAWIEAWSVPWAYESDGRAIEQLARMHDEYALLGQAFDVGSLLEKPIVTPKGEVVGTEYYTNPAHGERRKLEAALDKMRAALGLTPMARSRLGQEVIKLEEGAERLAQQRIKDGYRKAITQTGAK